MNPRLLGSATPSAKVRGDLVLRNLQYIYTYITAQAASNSYVQGTLAKVLSGFPCWCNIAHRMSVLQLGMRLDYYMMPRQRLRKSVVVPYAWDLLRCEQLPLPCPSPKKADCFTLGH
jgi:hypothetical protein